MKTIRQLALEKALEAAGPDAVGKPTLHSALFYHDNPRNTRWQEDRIITSIINGVADQEAEIPPMVEFPEDVDVPIYRPPMKVKESCPTCERPFHARKGVSNIKAPSIVMIDAEGKRVKG
jgi:hypothetical protein